MKRSMIVAGFVWFVSFGHWHTDAAGQEPPATQPAVPELMKREVSRGNC